MYLNHQLLSVLALACTTSGHMIMLTPTPFNNETIDNSPLDSSGANYPCKSTGDASFYSAAGIKNEMAIGQPQTLSFRGSAVHGGGSCQLAITWSGIESFDGGCPAIDGSGPSTYQFSIPNGGPAGDYVFAWTWISKLAGQPEYYMNCAPITVTGGSSKARRHAKDNPLRRAAALPNLGVFNLGSINSCKTTPGTDPTYPEPGPNVDKPPGTRNYASPAGSNCFPKGGSAAGDLSGGTGGGSSGGSSAAPSASAAAPSGGSSAVTPTGAAPSAAGGASSGSGALAGSSAAPSASAAAGASPGGSSGSESSGATGAAGTTPGSVVATPVTSGGVTATPAALSFPPVTPLSSAASSAAPAAA